jgi:cystathionine gamma-synthase/cystathionine gamma-lyase
VHGGGGEQVDAATGAVVAPLVLATTFAQPSLGVNGGFEYARCNNPTRQTFERTIASLCGGEHCVAFASGCAATAAVFHTLRHGDGVVCHSDVYGGTLRLIEQVCVPTMALRVTYKDLSGDVDADDKQILDVDCGAAANDIVDGGGDNLVASDSSGDTTTNDGDNAPKLVWLETPTNPSLKVCDIAAVAALAHARGSLLAVDNTFLSPALQTPLKLGADIVVHSITKYINGHSDVTGGVVVCKDAAIAKRLRLVQKSTGAVLSPFDCLLGK